jgi:uncharacterized protein (TIGR02466 family)
MQIQGLFPTPLISSVLPNSSGLCADLRALILERRTQSQGEKRSNVGGWQSEADFPAWSGTPGSILIEAVREVADVYTVLVQEGQLERHRIDWGVRAWANVSERGAANELHYHPGAYWSCVFYVDDGGIDGSDAYGGALEFVDPRGPVPLMHAPTVKMAIAQCANAGLGERIYPKNGMLVMFPSWLGHRVTAYNGNGTRISIAINFSA